MVNIIAVNINCYESYLLCMRRISEHYFELSAFKILNLLWDKYKCARVYKPGCYE